MNKIHLLHFYSPDLFQVGHQGFPIIGIPRELEQDDAAAAAFFIRKFMEAQPAADKMLMPAEYLLGSAGFLDPVSDQ